LAGSATDPGLDGSKLAVATDSLVVVLQYRLGAVCQLFKLFTIDFDYCNQLGFNAPDGTMNLAVQDIATALAFLHSVLPSFGADPSKITLSGQSSGANMIRALLGAPSVASRFRSAILHSDTMVSLSTVIVSLLIDSYSGLWFPIYEHAEDPSKLFQLQA